MKRNNGVTVIGLGEIGFETLKEFSKKRRDVFGVDIDEKRLAEIRKKGYRAGTEIPQSAIYILAVYSTKQVLDVAKKLIYGNHPLLVIESTVLPGTYQKLLKWGHARRAAFDLVLFPHRYNPGDPRHHVFNLTRVMGGKPNALTRAMKFYARYIPKKLVYQTTGDIAELCKPLENAYRYTEIAFAEELSILCKKKKIDFNTLRLACNTKWNIDIKEARDGINGKCLPKDIELINTFFGKKTFFTKAVDSDVKYKGLVGSKK